MSAAQNLAADPAVASSTAKTSSAAGMFSNASWLAIACVACGCLPTTYAHFVNLLSKPHYQHAFLVPLGVWLIWRQDLHRLSRSFAPLHWAPLMCLILGAAALGVAAWAGSPWVGMIATLILLLPCLWWRGGWSAWKQGWRGWLFAWTLVPLPLGMDEDLTLWLRTITTKLTSRVLDELGVLHLSYANVIELPGKPLFVADACSGINSLYVLMAAALFYAMWSGRTLLHTLLLLAATFYWVMVENVARLSLVALAWQRQMDWSQGTSHTWLGIVLFVVSLALVLSTDQLLRFLIPGGKVRVGDYFRKNANY
ncbi:MAG: exosortase/archaeosortase family protein, partial [Planctomycetaceae bacterium]